MNLKENLSRSKEVLGAYFRQGAKELAGAFYGAGTVAQHPEYGMAFSKTPGQVADGLRGVEHSGMSRDDTAPSMLDRYTQPAPEQEATAPEYDSPTIEQDIPELDRD